MLQSVGLQRVRYDFAIEQKIYISPVIDKIEAYLQNNMQNCNHKIDTKHQEKYRLKTKTDLT